MWNSLHGFGTRSLKFHQDPDRNVRENKILKVPCSIPNVPHVLERSSRETPLWEKLLHTKSWGGHQGGGEDIIRLYRRWKANEKQIARWSPRPFPPSAPLHTRVRSKGWQVLKLEKKWDADYFYLTKPRRTNLNDLKYLPQTFWP